MTVASFWEEVYPRLKARDKRALIDRYASFLGEIAVKEPGRALPLPSACCIVDSPDGAAFYRCTEPDHGQSDCHVLAPLLAWFWVSGSRSERFRFLRGFGAPAGALHSWSLADIEEGALLSLQELWNAAVSATQTGGNGYRVERRSGFKVWRRDDAATASVLAKLLPDPDRAYTGAQICKPGSRNHTARVELVGGDYLLKRYNCRGLMYRLQNSLRPSRAVKNWNLIHHFQLRGVSVPEPCLCLEERHCRLLGRSYILMAFSPGQTLRQTWPGSTDRERKALMASLAMLLGRMHRFGLLHGDLKWDNILVQRDANILRVILIDFDGARQVTRPSRKRANKDLLRFQSDLRSNDPSGYWEARFMRGWSAWLAHL
jgi:tRNA A-37 threonylcarbamoyl transferase component Bud32